MMEERSAILQFTTYWRQQAHNTYLMGRPEVQVVLLALAETAQMWINMRDIELMMTDETDADM